MASNITYPDKHAVWFIEGNNLCLVTNADSSGNTSTTTSGRKTWKAIQESVTDGILMYYNLQVEFNVTKMFELYPVFAFGIELTIFSSYLF